MSNSPYDLFKIIQENIKILKNYNIKELAVKLLLVLDCFMKMYITFIKSYIVSTPPSVNPIINVSKARLEIESLAIVYCL